LARCAVLPVNLEPPFDSSARIGPRETALVGGLGTVRRPS
jgi:hypothetical protein